MMQQRVNESVSDLNDKLFILFIDGDHLNLKMVTPSNGEEMLQLRQLNEKGLSKLMVIDTSYSHTLKLTNIRKLINNLSTGNNSITELTDCTPNHEGLVQISASNICYRKLALPESEPSPSNIQRDRAQIFYGGVIVDRIRSFFRKQSEAFLYLFNLYD